MATVSEVARLIGVEPGKVKRWATEFAEYLSLTARPAKGKERQFSEADLRVLAVIANHLRCGNDSERHGTLIGGMACRDLSQVAKGLQAGGGRTSEASLGEVRAA